MSYQPTPQERAVLMYVEGFDPVKHRADMEALKSRLTGGSDTSSGKAGGPRVRGSASDLGRTAEGALCLTSRD